MYNQQFQNTGISQYQGPQKQYQPVGAVQSFYGQSQQQYGTNPSTESYHTANYRGNQYGHDQGLRGDSLSPSSQQGFTAPNYGSARYGIRGNEQALSSQNALGQQFAGTGAFGARTGFVPTSSFAQTSFGQPASYGQASFGQNQWQGQTAGQWQNQGQGFAPSMESFHTANYRGNQPGHDQSLRGDSFSPSSQQGFGMQSGFQGGGVDYSSARYGIRGNEQAMNPQNNFGQQFGTSF